MLKRKYSINDGFSVLPATMLWSAVCGLPSCCLLISPIKTTNHKLNDYDNEKYLHEKS